MKINFDHKATFYQKGILIDGESMITPFTENEILLYDNELSCMMEDMKKYSIIEYIKNICRLNFTTFMKVRMCYYIGLKSVKDEKVIKISIMKRMLELSENDNPSITEILEYEYNCKRNLFLLNADAIDTIDFEDLSILTVCYLAGAISAILDAIE